MKNLIKGFKDAFRGLLHISLNERNFKIQLIALLIVIMMGIFFRIKSMEWMILVLTSTIVLGLEAINSSIEELCDEVDPKLNPKIGRTKDIAAAAVLIAAISALIIAGFIFIPYVF